MTGNSTEASPSVGKTILGLLPYYYAKRHGVIITGMHNDAYQVAVHEKTHLNALLELRRKIGKIDDINQLTMDRFEENLNQRYHHQQNSDTAQLVNDIENDFDIDQLANQLTDDADLLDAEDDAPIIKFLNALFTQATKESASDIHIEAAKTYSYVRFRIDGLLRDTLEMNKNLHNALISRIKIMANLDIAEKRLPQDGRFSLKIAGKSIDFRISTLPTSHGERAVLRILNKDASLINVDNLGMGEYELTSLKKIINSPHGLFLVTGPTGAGKSTTLYAALAELDTKKTNIMTVEDPVEFDIDGIGQTQVNSKIDMSFSRGLRSLLRQDPDVIMVGEIRDSETATICVQASLTGHLVLSTLHTNDSIGAIPRLLDLGLEPFLLSSSLLGVVSQRLIRKICSHCKKSKQTSEKEMHLLGINHPTTIYVPNGCEQCYQTGYIGRIGLYELLVIDESIKQMITESGKEHQIRKYALASGMNTIRMQGCQRVLNGDTSLEEVQRITKELA